VLFQCFLEQCESAAEFLLEPWVLIQLPYQPILMHQWAVALMAEALKFQKELADLYSMTYPRRFRIPVKKLIFFNTQMLGFSVNVFKLVNFYIASAIESIHKLLDRPLAVITRWFPLHLPIIEFVLSKDCRNFIKALKRMALNESANLSDPEMSQKTVTEFGEHFSCYNYEFWKQEAKIVWLFPFYEEYKTESLRKKYEGDGTLKITEADVSELLQFVDEKIIQTGRVKGSCREILLLAAHKEAKQLVPHHKMYMKFLGENKKIILK